MPNFTAVTVTVDSTDYTFAPYDKGINGAFVYREVNGVATVSNPRAIVSTAMKDDSNDKLTVQLNAPRVCESDGDCMPPAALGTDLVKLELRFLATTSKQDRIMQIDKALALFEEFRSTIEDREVIYS